MKTISLDYKTPQEKELEDTSRTARMDAVAYIGSSPKTSGRIMGWLLKKGYPDSIIQLVLHELKEEAVINDSKIAVSIIRSHRGKKVESSSSILKRLIRLGVDADIAEICVQEEHLDHERELSEAIILLRLKFSQKMDTIDELDPGEQLRLKQKIFNCLMNRGYSRETTLSAMNNVLREQMYTEE